MRAFIVRPFGVKQGINFDAVEALLIRPALAAAGIEGGPTGDIIEAGNIRVDMFFLLLTADLVIADLTVHNANVFYELGVRHALRDRSTVMIRAEVDLFPFDLQTDRYLLYDKADPAAKVDALARALKATIDNLKPDSPVFQSLPTLAAQEPGRFIVVPSDFGEDVTLAKAGGCTGDLAMLAAEARFFPWSREGLRAVGHAQFALQAWEGARLTWESVLDFDPSDKEANTLLATIYQRLKRLPESDICLTRVLGRKDLTSAERAEALALRGRNAKTQWLQQWGDAPADQRRAVALNSSFLETSYEAYESAFEEDLNHFYSGLNALAMLTVIIELATAMKSEWESRFDEVEDAASDLRQKQAKWQRLAGAVEVSLDARQTRLTREQKTDIWLDFSWADFDFLSKRKKAPARYQKAVSQQNLQATGSARAQLDIYRQIGVLLDSVEAALKVFPPAPAAAQAVLPTRVLLFTGHKIDDPGRKVPRFPAEKESLARERIKEIVLQEKQKAAGPVTGLAGGASGGDILFHEVCAELNIPTELYLALPMEKFLATSVQQAGPDWVERFRRLYKSRNPRVLAKTEDLPRWLRAKPNYSIWERNNLWMLQNALSYSNADVTLIALWDEAKGDAGGGTEDMVRQAQERGAAVRILKTKEIFGI